MPRRCYLTEKDIVAKHVAEFFGIKERIPGGYLLANGDLVTHNKGHLLNIGEPDDYLSEAQRQLRGFAQLPILPAAFKTRPNKENAEHVRHVVKLLKQADIIVNAGDADREGQLIADEIIAYAGIDPSGTGVPVEKVILKAYDADSMRTAFDPASRLNNRDSINDRYAAEARQQSDWVVGMNGSRALRAALFSMGVFPKQSPSLGRVQTPTLALVVIREQQIRSFKSVLHYVPEVELPDGVVLRWSSRIEGADDRGIDEQGRIIDKRVAEAIVDRIQRGLEGVVVDYDEQVKEQAPPLPYNLPKLQAEMSARHGMSTKESSAAAQSLYDTRKMITYVGTDCQHLPKSMHAEAPRVLAGISGMYTKLANGANPTIEYACWNDSMVEAHHGIVPTGVSAPGLSEDEKKVFDAIARRYMAQFYPKHKYQKFKLEANYGDDAFASSWSKPLVEGWKAVDRQFDEDVQEAEGMESAPAMRMRAK